MGERAEDISMVALTEEKKTALREAFARLYAASNEITKIVSSIDNMPAKMATAELDYSVWKRGVKVKQALGMMEVPK